MIRKFGKLEYYQLQSLLYAMMHIPSHLGQSTEHDLELIKDIQAEIKLRDNMRQKSLERAEKRNSNYSQHKWKNT